jgi:hypothetical protein
MMARRWNLALAILSALICLRIGERPDVVREVIDPQDSSECTTAVIAGSATANGRPLLWKNRDRNLANQEIVWFNDGLYPYVTIVNAGDSTQAWGGVNSMGFAVEDANSSNVPDTIPGQDDDGLIMKLALQTCQTVDDFQAILDSTSIIGNTRPAIYGVIDATGGASMFETFPHSYVRYDASDTACAPLGILVRANFSYAGDTSSQQGLYRHDRAKALLESAASGDFLTSHFICRTVARDLRNSDSLDPYPLPYEGQQGNLPWGFISFTEGVSRSYTVSACIVEGVLPEENPALATMWAFPMAVEFGVALPFWAVAGNTPPEVNGSVTAPLCNEGIRLKTLAQKGAELAGAINTYFLVDGQGGGLLLKTFPLEDCAFHQADSALALWRAMDEPDSAGMAELTAQLAQMTFAALNGWPRPGDVFLQPHSVVNLTAGFTEAQGLVLRWPAVRKDIIGMPITPSGYEIWRYDDYPPTVVTGDSLGFTADTVFVVERVPEELKGFFDVRTVR